MLVYSIIGYLDNIYLATTNEFIFQKLVKFKMLKRYLIVS